MSGEFSDPVQLIYYYRLFHCTYLAIMRKLILVLGASAVLIPTLAFASFDVDLGYGSTGSEVAKVQQFLTAQGHFTAEITGNFFSLTLAAVQAFQTAQDIIPVSGFWGPVTRARANAIISAGGSTGSSIPTGGSSTQSSEVQSLLALIAQLQARIAELIRVQTLSPNAASCEVGGTKIQSGTTATFYDTNAPASVGLCSAHAQSRTCTNGNMTGSASYLYSSCTDSLGPPPPPGGSCTVGSTSTSAFSGAILQSGATGLFYSTTSPATMNRCSSYSQARTCTNGVISGASEYIYWSCDDSAGSCKADSIILPNGSSTTFYSTRITTPTSAGNCQSYGSLRTCTNGVLSGNSAYQYASCSLQIASCTLDGVTVQSGGSITSYSTRETQYGCSNYSQVRKCTNGAFDGHDSYQYVTCAPLSCALDSKTIKSGEAAPFYSTLATTYGCSNYVQTRTCTNGQLDGYSGYQYATCRDL